MTAVLYQFAADPGVESASPFCVKVHRVLGLKGVDYTPRAVGSPAELKKLNPGVGKVPVLDWDGELIADSSEIARRLDERVPQPPLWPEDPQLRARCRLLEDWADEALYWFAVYYRWGVDENFEAFRRRFFDRILPVPLKWIVPKVARRQAVGQVRAQGLGRRREPAVGELLAGHLRMLTDLLGDGQFFFGGQCTLADIAVFGPLRQLAVDTVPQAARRVAEHPALLAWLARVDEATASAHTVGFPPRS